MSKKNYPKVECPVCKQPISSNNLKAHTKAKHPGHTVKAEPRPSVGPHLCATCSLAYPECGIEKDAKDLKNEKVFTRQGDIIVACMNHTLNITKKQPVTLCDSCLYDYPNCEGQDSQNFDMVNDIITRCDEHRKVEGAKPEEKKEPPPGETPPPPAPVEEVKRKPPKTTIKVKKGEEKLCSLCQEPLKQRPLNRKLDVLVCENRACRLYRERQGIVVVKKR